MNQLTARPLPASGLIAAALAAYERQRDEEAAKQAQEWVTACRQEQADLLLRARRVWKALHPLLGLPLFPRPRFTPLVVTMPGRTHERVYPACTLDGLTFVGDTGYRCGGIAGYRGGGVLLRLYRRCACGSYTLSDPIRSLADVGRECLAYLSDSDSCPRCEDWLEEIFREEDSE